MHAVIEGPELEKIHAFSLHLNLLDAGRRAQIRKVVDYIRTRVPANEKILLAGDFNDWREWISDYLRIEIGLLEAYQSIHGRHAASFPSFWPVLCMDRIYSRGFKPVAAKCLSGVTWNRLSDHLPLQVDFE